MFTHFDRDTLSKRHLADADIRNTTKFDLRHISYEDRRKLLRTARSQCYGNCEKEGFGSVYLDSSTAHARGMSV
jgi:hypothetical protein